MFMYSNKHYKFSFISDKEYRLLAYISHIIDKMEHKYTRLVAYLYYRGWL